MTGKENEIVNKLSNSPLYEQVFEQIKNAVRNGDYKKGNLLPSAKINCNL